jgi:Fe2+ or Zn2+ uptake regulation protein
VAPPCAQFRRHLRGVGLKYTTERADILDAASGFEHPFDAEALMAVLDRRARTVSKATAYRTLKLLVDAGILVERLHARDSVRYEFAPSDHNGQSALATQIEIRHPDGTRTVTSDPRIDALVLELCQTAGVQARKRTLLIDCGS